MAIARESMIFIALEDCHRQTLEHLQDLETLVGAMETDRLDAQGQARMAEIESFFSSTARKHHALEERYFFPPLLADGEASLVATIRILQQDHGWIEENWLELSPQLSAIASGNHWVDMAELHHGVQVFAELVRMHLTLEDSLVYPLTRARLEESALATA